MAAEEGAEFFDGEITSEILVRLPVKSLARFRCVSKSWGALISDPYFTKKHLSYLKKGITKYTSRLLYSLYHPASLDHEALKDLKDHSDASFANRELDFPAPVYPCPYRPRSIVGSCDGLVCIIDEDGGYFVLWNPCTRFFRKLHKTAGLPRICYPYLMKHTICGFGYDSATDDYKVILGDIGGGVAIVHVYALKTGSWKVVQIPIKPFFTISGRGFFLNGALHWLSENTGSRQIILSFDLVKEKFYDMIPLPEGDISFGGMRVVRNRLCVFNHLASRRGVCTIWLMKEYGVKRSWTQVAKFSSKDFPEAYKNVFTMLPLCILEGGQVLLDTDHCEHLLVLYDPKEKTFKNITNIRSELRCGALVYTETLVSPGLPIFVVN